MKGDPALAGRAMPLPHDRLARDRFVLDRRGSRDTLDPWRHQGVVIDREPDGHGGIVDAATVFLTGSECPWRCVMCDLWRHTTATDTPPGAIPSQIRAAIASMARPRSPTHIKLYNAGSLFDPRAVPPADDPAIARAVSGFARVIVESHPRLVGARAWRFRDRLAKDDGGAKLEVAMGLETANPDALEQLHKDITLDAFARAAADLHANEVSLRVFVLVHPPFVSREERVASLERSIDAAFHCGARVVSLIPTRSGNGAMEELERLGVFERPSLGDLEEAAALALRRARGVVLADLWDLDACSLCEACLPARRERLQRLNLEQRVPSPISCESCGVTTPV